MALSVCLQTCAKPNTFSLPKDLKRWRLVSDSGSVSGLVGAPGSGHGGV